MGNKDKRVSTGCLVNKTKQHISILTHVPSFLCIDCFQTIFSQKVTSAGMEGLCAYIQQGICICFSEGPVSCVTLLCKDRTIRANKV